MNPNLFTCSCDPLPHLRLIVAEGADAAQFLQGQVTCDVRAVSADRSALGALCNPKGRVIATFRLLRLPSPETAWGLVLSHDLADAVLQRLQRYVLRAQVKLAAGDAEWRLSGLAGADLAAALQAVNLALPDSLDAVQATATAAVVRVEEHPPRALVAGRPEAVAELERICQPANATAWRLADLSAGWPWLSAAVSESFTPHMLNLDRLGAVSFQKGCYTGQEVVARSQYLGQVKRRLARFAVVGATAPQPGAVLGTAAGDESEGNVVEAVQNGAEWQLLAVVAAEPSGELRLGGPQGPSLRPL